MDGDGLVAWRVGGWRNKSAAAVKEERKETADTYSSIMLTY